MPAFAAAAVLGVVVFMGFSGGGSDSTAAVDSPSGSNPGEVDGTGLTVPLTTLPLVVIKDDPAIQKTQLASSLRKGSFGEEVKAMQQRLTDLGFDPGPVDGQFGVGTEESLWAFEGLISGLKYDQQSGVLTNDLWQTMQDPIAFQPRRQGGVGNTHMEIYLDLQVGIVFTDDKPKLITHISSGTGETWCEVVKQDTDNEGRPLETPIEKDVCGVSKTPGGVFKFYRRYEGNRQGPLGGMMNPVYFNYGIAVHGAHNVPNKPASHGCIRIPESIADYFPSLVKNGDRVYVWDGKKEPEQQSKKEMTPIFNYPNPDSTTTSSSSTSTTTTVKSTTATKPTTTTTKPTTTTTKPTTTTSSAPATPTS
ncbi:MAG TPA: L,D-transpeptidase family protein [Microthrixaceae bacterium]|nr:L,D-transpeptidase family protein [Microthrixaceae bacterium]